LSARAPILPRVLAVLAALCLVGAFTLALFYPPTMPLQRLVAQFDQQILVTAQEWVREHWGDGIWSTIFVPLLARPGWLVPLACALVLAGLALTSLTARRVPGSPRWKN
jgi:hypothetical protein